MKISDVFHLIGFAIVTAAVWQFVANFDSYAKDKETKQAYLRAQKTAKQLKKLEKQDVVVKFAKSAHHCQGFHFKKIHKTNRTWCYKMAKEYLEYVLNESSIHAGQPISDKYAQFCHQTFRSQKGMVKFCQRQLFKKLIALEEEYCHDTHQSSMEEMVCRQQGLVSKQ